LTGDLSLALLLSPLSLSLSFFLSPLSLSFFLLSLSLSFSSFLLNSMSDSVPPGAAMFPPEDFESFSSRHHIEVSNRLNDGVETIHPRKLVEQEQQKEFNRHLPHRIDRQEQEEQASQSDDSFPSSTSQLSTLRHEEPQPIAPPPDFDFNSLVAPPPSHLSVRDAAQFPKAVASTYLPPVGKHLMDGGKLGQNKRGAAIRHGPPTAHLQQYSGQN